MKQLCVCAFVYAFLYAYVCVCRDGAGDLQHKRKKGPAPEFRKSRTQRNGVYFIFSYFFYHMYEFVPGAALSVLQDPLHIC